MQSVAVFGLGAMGEPMATNLLAKGFPVSILTTRSKGAVSRLTGLGARPAASIAEAARNAEIVLLVLPSSREVELVIAGEGGLIETLPEGVVVVDCSTSDPSSTRRLGALLNARGVSMVDAALTRGVQGAKQGKLAYFAGGRSEDIEKARPCLEAMGDTICHVGELGAGHVAKVLSNMLSYGTVALVNETLMLGGRLGVELKPLYDALMLGAASKALESFGPRIIAGEHESPRVSIENVCAHLEIASRLAGDKAAPMFVTAAAQEVYRWAASHGFGGNDMSVIGKLWRAPDGRSDD